MAFLKIVKNHSLNLESSIKLKNAQVEITFAFENSLLLNYYEHFSTPTKEVISALGYLFSRELVKFFNNKIPGGLFEVLTVSPHIQSDADLSFVDVSLENNEMDSPTQLARIYGTQNAIEHVNSFLLDQSVLTQVSKVTGYPVFTRQIHIDELYNISLLEQLRILSSRELLLKCSYLIEGKIIDFYFPQKLVCHFCSFEIKKTPSKILPFNIILGKIFSEIFLNYLNSTVHVFAKPISQELRYFKDKELLEFNLISNTKQLEFFIDKTHKMFLIKLLSALNFTHILPNLEKPNLDHLNIPFPIEIGVTYLKQSEFKNLTEGDIIVFDKTCLQTESLTVDKCVINLNGISLIADVKNGSCEVTHFTKDW